ncbi:hypothetical protein ACFOY2_44815 [Nonomuraea purpurea]|uniref:Ribbon-helix-helix protein, CopG family n=1 Tax=Nonomuraea purpurea TaxID=1849276 RepID=A0ABV8GNG4_9ACTN
MAMPIPSRRNAPDADPSAAQETTSFIVNLDKTTLDALHQKARSDGRYISEIVRTAVEREVSNMTHATILIQRWNLQCEDLDRAADALSVDRISDEVMHRLGLHRNQEG